MNIEKLIHWLSKHQIEVIDDRQEANGFRVIYFTAQLPEVPHHGRNVWYTLVLSKGQTEISQSEIDALLRHCWHGELEIPHDSGADA